MRLADEWLGFLPAGSLAAIGADLGLSYAQIGLILTSVLSGGLVGNALAVAADFVDRRLLAAGGGLVYALCLLALGLGQSLAVMLTAGFLLGVASDALVHGCEVALVDLYRDELAPVLGRVNALGAAGDLLGPVTLSLAAAAGVGWRQVFVGAGVAMALYSLALARHSFPPPRPAAGLTPIGAVAAVARDRRIIVLGVVSGLFGLLDEPFLGFMIAFLEDDRGLAPALATTTAAAIVGAGIVGYLAVPIVVGSGSPDRLLVPLAALLTVSVLLIVGAEDLALRFGAALAFGLTSALFWSSLQATYLGLRPGQAGTSQAVVSTIGLFGIGVPVLVGAVSDAAGLMAGLGLYAVVPLAILALLVLRGRSIPE